MYSFLLANICTKYLKSEHIVILIKKQNKTVVINLVYMVSDNLWHGGIRLLPVPAHRTIQCGFILRCRQLWVLGILNKTHF